MARRTYRERAGRKPVLIEHHTWGEFVNYAEESISQPIGYDGVTGDATSASNGYWTGTPDWETAMRYAREGWPEGESKVDAVRRRLETRVISHIVKDDIGYDVEGMAFDVARFLEGEPEHWMRPEESQLAGKVRHVKLVVNIAASGGVSDRTLQYRGAAIAALVELLEYNGQCVELWIANGIDGTTDDLKSGFRHLAKVKAYDQPMEPSRIAFALVNTSTFRRLGFALMGRHWSHGIPTDFKPEDTTIYVPCSYLYADGVDWESLASVETWVIGKLAEQGVLLRDAE